MEIKEGNRFAFKPAQWVYEIEDNRVWSSVMTLLFEHQYTEKPFNEESLKAEIDEFGNLTPEQAQEVFDLIVAHKDQ